MAGATRDLEDLAELRQATLGVTYLAVARIPPLQVGPVVYILLYMNKDNVGLARRCTRIFSWFLVGGLQ